MNTLLVAPTADPSIQAPTNRRLTIGAEVCETGTHFRVWAPKRRAVTVVFDGGVHPDFDLAADPEDGYFAGLAPHVVAGDRYKLRLDGESATYPDPASRFQPDGVHGPSQVVDPRTFQWTDRRWPGVTPDGQVLYELHVGTFTPEGTWAAAAAKLPLLTDVGITCLEVMPVPEFAGSFGWGYDGVDLFAPYHGYGTPDDFRRFVDAAHAAGLGVILDVVYNHFGPDGNYLKQFADTYTSTEHMTDWGEALNFDGPGSDGPRAYFVANATMWIAEYQLDGFRFDATQAILDTTPDHILAAINRAAREAAPHKSLYLINENEPQDTWLVRKPPGGFGLDALWNDDFHHSAMVALTGRNEAYYTDYLGRAGEFVAAAKYGYLYQGQRYKWQERRRGTPGLDLPPTAYVHFLQNHDQIANSGHGMRVCQLSSPGQYRAMTALWLLMPQTPMFFMGQEFAATNPFHYFADHNPELGKLIRQGRAKELSQFPSIATDEMQRKLVDPTDRQTFEACKLDWHEREADYHGQALRLHRDLLRLRRDEPCFRRVQRRGEVDGAVLDRDALVLRYFDDAVPDGTGDRLVVVNFGTDLELNPAPEPLLAPPRDHRWAVLLGTEHPAYGGTGIPPPSTEREGWLLTGRSAVVLRPLPADRATVETRIKVPGSAQAARKKE